MYGSGLSAKSEKYNRDCQESSYYYHAVHIHVITTGAYRISSISSIDTYGYVYEDNFDPLDPFAKCNLRKVMRAVLLVSLIFIPIFQPALHTYWL